MKEMVEVRPDNHGIHGQSVGTVVVGQPARETIAGIGKGPVLQQEVPHGANIARKGGQERDFDASQSGGRSCDEREGFPFFDIRGEGGWIADGDDRVVLL